MSCDYYYLHQQQYGYTDYQEVLPDYYYLHEQ